MFVKRSRMISPFKRMGGKSKLAPWIVQHLPRHETNVEAFAAAAPVLLWIQPLPSPVRYEEERF